MKQEQFEQMKAHSMPTGKKKSHKFYGKAFRFKEASSNQ